MTRSTVTGSATCWGLAGGVVGLVVIVALVAAWWFSAPGAGPLVGSTSRSLTSLPVDTGTQATIGHLTLRNTGDRPLRLRDVRAVQPKAGSQRIAPVVAVEAVDPRELGDGIGTIRGKGFDIVPATLRHPVDGYRVDPGAEVNLLFRFAARADGTARYDAVEVDYEVGSRRHTLTQESLIMVVCVPETAPCDEHLD